MINVAAREKAHVSIWNVPSRAAERELSFYSVCDTIPVVLESRQHPPKGGKGAYGC